MKRKGAKAEPRVLVAVVNELLRAYGYSSPGINYIVSLTLPSSVMNLRACAIQHAKLGCARRFGSALCENNRLRSINTEILHPFYLEEMIARI